MDVCTLHMCMAEKPDKLMYYTTSPVWPALCAAVWLVAICELCLFVTSCHDMMVACFMYTKAPWQHLRSGMHHMVHSVNHSLCAGTEQAACTHELDPPRKYREGVYEFAWHAC